MRRDRSDGSSIGAAAVHLFLVLYSLLTLVPFAWAILTSLKTTREIADSDRLLPVALDLGAYRLIFQSDFKLWFFNSMLVALSITVIGVIGNTMAGYALARLKFRGRESVFQALMLLVMVPAQVTMIPAYLIVARLGLADTHLGIVLTSVVNIASIFMMRQFFIDFPREIEEAALLDGCTPVTIFLRIVVPMAAPALATQAIFVFMGAWNEFMKPLLYISSPDNYLLTQGLNAASKQYEKSAAWNITMAGSVITILPILGLYVWLNKYFLKLNDAASGSK
ncbi:carbohydrate ABC transporter permease [Paucibacter sp. R3-3]|uniref:Carbohydrate ABC transporter permease n=1 Tax=Roseateles agri TaxID=3098619 RepID=A0ABU5DFS2_9BURK|nr:carbohydrate ABC transporter permease [Paucibacter sp. R3-3]MDY0745131.1 carbohydrate ABC transporter permease [Paucibacter sp. R3-3]